LFLFSIRTALIVAVTIPFALLFSFICLDWRHIPANFRRSAPSISGIIVDGAVVMVENIFRRTGDTPGAGAQCPGSHPGGGARVGRADLLRHRGDRRRIPADLRSRPSGQLFQPMADTMSALFRLPASAR
jgi:cobalt-zinc-cadmium resistance protein CzcA